MPIRGKRWCGKLSRDFWYLGLADKVAANGRRTVAPDSGHPRPRVPACSRTCLERLDIDANTLYMLQSACGGEKRRRIVSRGSASFVGKPTCTFSQF
jgi:hypothetical protein